MYTEELLIDYRWYVVPFLAPRVCSPPSRQVRRAVHRTPLRIRLRTVVHLVRLHEPLHQARWLLSARKAGVGRLERRDERSWRTSGAVRGCRSGRVHGAK